MKNIFTIIAVTIFCLVGLAACSSQYVISTKDGKMLTTDSKPKLDEETGMYIYDDEEGREMMIQKDDVVQIMER
ncbi:YgdI/YgdR family lipoprotein [Pseudaeromonas paramecii]|uniref:YgdI/YgdR family lipoprotein n=1 Tax=Pseudaeromonas paramecii TaxID=2138166 RepID=A0ABP8QDT6_9GAMM